MKNSRSVLPYLCSSTELCFFWFCAPPILVRQIKPLTRFAPPYGTPFGLLHVEVARGVGVAVFCQSPGGPPAPTLIGAVGVKKHRTANIAPQAVPCSRPSRLQPQGLLAISRIDQFVACSYYSSWATLSRKGTLSTTPAVSRGARGP